MPEKEYRASRICRVLGNPTAYCIIKILRPTEKKSPTEIAKEIGSSVSNISKTLRLLRQIDLVRYDTERNQKRYYLKENDILRIFQSLEGLVEKIRHKKY